MPLAACLAKARESTTAEKGSKSLSTQLQSLLVSCPAGCLFNLYSKSEHRGRDMWTLRKMFNYHFEI